MIKAGAIVKGTCLLIKDEPFVVVEREFVNPGKGSAFVRLKMRNLKTGLNIKQTIKTAESVEEIDAEERNCQYLYADNESYHFMDNQSFEQYAVPVLGMEDKKFYLKENLMYKIVVWEGNPIDVVLPLKITLEVVEANEGLKGDTVSGAAKPVIMETGLTIRVPLFIKNGDKLVINTENQEYVERA